MKASETISALLGVGLAPHLKRLGFKKQALVWRTQRGEVTLLVQAQLSSGSLGETGQFALNLGTYLPALERLLGPRPLEAPREVDCTARTRIGPDSWWQVDGATDLATLGAEVLAHFEAVGAPWLERAADLEQLDDSLALDRRFAMLQTPLARVGLAVAVNRRERAQERLTGMLESVYATRRERAAQFPDDPFGLSLLANARKFAADHGLVWHDGSAALQGQR